ncbi:hypothetical protein J4406_02680 [Candidatus Woesearchaeota archaeon]|nr:hypothetical protein [Candidatus Woesearchaeota archaeon]
MKQSLTKRILEEFGERKHKGRLSVITNLNEGGIISPVPHDQEHIEFCTNLVGDVRKLAKVIPTHIGYKIINNDYYEINSVITGESGMEQGYGIRHSLDDIIMAHNKVLMYIYNGEIPRKISKIQIIEKYSS